MMYITFIDADASDARSDDSDVLQRNSGKLGY